ncbi:MAG: acyl-CoA dehydrogenase [Rickettsiales bacterium]|nr:acyl-CoA dehydrogenase [Rickettsiales bacterium]
MSTYRPPYEDYAFILHHVLKVQEKLASYEEETARFMMETASSFAEKELTPLYNDTNDKHLAANFTIADGTNFGEVTLPPGYKQAYDTFIETGLQGIVADPAYGEMAVGQPHIVGAVIDELLHSANGDFSLIPTLTHSAYLGIYTYGTQAQKQKYLPDLSSGVSSGIMAMTEPSAGSDLSNARTFAEPQADGSYHLSGQKIYISGGDNHYTGVSDTGNIIHVVLAKVKDTETGEIDDRVSMFISSKILVDENGNRTANSLGPIGIEHKMGMAGSATCTMEYKAAKGELIGERGKGIATMFAVMNEARNHVARQAIGCAEAAFQKAYWFASDAQAGRRMGRAQPEPISPEKEADLIITHPAVRKLLLKMRSQISGARMFQLDTALQMDLAKESEEAAAWVSLMTNIVKAHVTEIGSQVTDAAIQVYGGMGFVEESGIARHYRDVRVTRIYEGTNQIQAVTLLRQMKHLPVFITKIQHFIDVTSLKEIATQLQESLHAVQRVSEALTSGDYNHFASGADELLELMGIVALGYYHGLCAQAASEAKSTPFTQTKLADAKFYYAHILTNHCALEKRALAGIDALNMPNVAL